jgi:hypothetical protein
MLTSVIRMLRDDRVKTKEEPTSIFDVKDAANRLG